MEPLADALRGELARLGPEAGLAEIVDRWPAAVGEAIARHAWPARVGRDGTLHAHAADAVWAFELGQQAGEIAARLGVAKVRFAPGPLPEPAPERREATPASPTREDDARAAEAAAAITDPELRESVQRAIRTALARGRDDRAI